MSDAVQSENTSAEAPVDESAEDLGHPRGTLAIRDSVSFRRHASQRDLERADASPATGEGDQVRGYCLSRAAE